MIDLPVALGFADRISPPNPETERVIIVAEFNERMMGFLVRNVERIFSFSADEMKNLPSATKRWTTLYSTPCWMRADIFSS